MAKQQPVAQQEKQQVVIFNAELPAHIAQHQGPARGMEDVTANDIIIPRLEQVQALSPARDRTSSNYILGAEEGMLFNSVTRELYGSEAFVIPVVYKKQWLVWKDRKQGGGAQGFRGAFNSELEAKARINELSAEEQGLDAVETAQHFCLIVGANGNSEEIVMSMAKSKLKVSKRWNSLMRIAGNDSFSRVYKVSSIVEANAKGEKYQNFAIALVGYTPEAQYRKAEALYSNIYKGGVVISQDYEGDATPAQHEEF